MAISVEETCVHALGLAHDVYPQPAPLHFGNQRGELKLGDTRADAAVDAVPEGEVAARILAVDNDPVSLRENALVAVGRGIPQRNLVALSYLVTEKFGIFGRGTTHVCERSLPADDLMHR